MYMSFRDNTAVLRESIRVSVIVWSFACLWKNAVEIWMIGYKGGAKFLEKIDIVSMLRIGGI